jgi:hypothetical protein
VPIQILPDLMQFFKLSLEMEIMCMVIILQNIEKKTFNFNLGKMSFIDLAGSERGADVSD